MSTVPPVTLDIAAFGCLSVLLRVKAGASVAAWGNVPPAMQGAKWADEHVWRVFAWNSGKLYYCRIELISEDGKPWDIDNVGRHVAKHPHLWERIE